MHTANQQVTPAQHVATQCRNLHGALEALSYSVEHRETTADHRAMVAASSADNVALLYQYSIDHDIAEDARVAITLAEDHLRRAAGLPHDVSAYAHHVAMADHNLDNARIRML